MNGRVAGAKNTKSPFAGRALRFERVSWARSAGIRVRGARLVRTLIPVDRNRGPRLIHVISQKLIPYLARKSKSRSVVGLIRETEAGHGKASVGSGIPR